MVQGVEPSTFLPRTEDEALLCDDASPLLLATSDASFVLPTSTAHVSSSALTESSSPSPIFPAYPGSDLASVEDSLALLTVKEDEAERMFRVLETIFRNALEHENSIDLSYFGSDNLWILLRRADVSSRQGYRDLNVLSIVRDVLDQMLGSGSRLLVTAAKTLADASRDSSWRLPFGQAGILDLFLGIIARRDVADDVVLQSFRLIGNTCSDTDENRQRVVDHNSLQHIIQQLENPYLMNIAIPVIYNICTEYGPAQDLARVSGLGTAAINVLARESLTSTPVLSYTCRLLDICLEDFRVESSPSHTVEILLRLASEPTIDINDCVSLVDAAILHMKHEKFQQHLITHDLLNIPLTSLSRLYTTQPNSNAITPRGLIAPIRDAAEEQELFRIRGSLIETLSDISALPEFSAKYSDMTSLLIEVLVEWLSVPRTQLQLCSCIMLGNLARSDALCNVMVFQLQIHTTLISVLKSSSDTQVLHSTLCFLRNLGLPAETKQTIGEANAIGTVARLWSSDTLPQIAYAAASFTRQIINGSLPNVRKLLASLSPDPDSPAHAKTYLSVLLSLFDKTDDVTTRMEVARTIAAILRCTHSTDRSGCPESTEPVEHRLYSLHANLGRPLITMITQSQWPIIRSEGWFALALMARSKEGSTALDAILNRVELFGALEQTIRAQPSNIGAGSTMGDSAAGSEALVQANLTDPAPGLEQEKDMRAKDRENAMVLVHELIRNRGDSMSDIRRSVLEDLLQGRDSSLSTQEMMTRMTRAG